MDNVEIFQVPGDYDLKDEQTGEPLEPGFYFWACFPGCLPDSDPVGAFETREQAEAEARLAFEDVDITFDPDEPPVYAD